MKDKAISKIEEIMDEVRATWLANDGGLTMAAQDTLDYGNDLIRLIESGHKECIMDYDQFCTMNGAESDMICIAQQWACGNL